MVPKIRMKSIINQKNWTTVLAAIIARSSSMRVLSKDSEINMDQKIVNHELRNTTGK